MFFREIEMSCYFFIAYPLDDWPRCDFGHDVIVVVAGGDLQ